MKVAESDNVPNDLICSQIFQDFVIHKVMKVLASSLLLGISPSVVGMYSDLTADNNSLFHIIAACLAIALVLFPQLVALGAV